MHEVTLDDIDEDVRCLVEVSAKEAELVLHGPSGG